MYEDGLDKTGRVFIAVWKIAAPPLRKPEVGVAGSGCFLDGRYAAYSGWSAMHRRARRSGARRAIEGNCALHKTMPPT